MADLGIVIVNYNTAEHLARCLRSLATGGLEGVEAEVWVVDNASDDDSVAAARAAMPDCNLIESDTNVGYAAANNLALRETGLLPAADGPGDGRSASGTVVAPIVRHVLLLNPDTIVPRGALARMLPLLAAEPDIGIMGPKLVRLDGTLDYACRRSFPTPAVSFYRFSGLSRLFPTSPRFGRYNVTYLDPELPTDVDSVVGACMLVRGECLAGVGALDERFWMYGEDLDFALRARAAGWRVAYRPQVTITHVKRAASAGSQRARFEFLRAMWLFYEKHYAATTPLPVHCCVLAALALRGGPALAREMRGTRAPA